MVYRYLKAAVLLCLLGCAAGCATSGKMLRVGGDEAAISGFIVPVKETFEEENGVALAIIRSSAGRELVDLEKGRVDAIISTQPSQVLLQEAAEEKIVLDPASLRQVEIGKSNTVIFLHRKNRTNRLTKKQLKAIFTGKTTNWKQLAGVDRHIVVVWNSSPEAENNVFIKDILDGAPLMAKVTAVGSYEELRKVVMATPGAIGMAPREFVAATVKVPKTPLVTSPVILVTKGEPASIVKRLTEILKDAEFIQ